MNKRLCNPLNEQLFEAIKNIETLEECYNFFEDVCSLSEIQSMAQRFEIAKLIDEGYIYEDIIEKTGASTTTISRIKRCLLYGAQGYRVALDNLKNKEKNK